MVDIIAQVKADPQSLIDLRAEIEEMLADIGVGVQGQGDVGAPAGEGGVDLNLGRLGRDSDMASAAMRDVAEAGGGLGDTLRTLGVGFAGVSAFVPNIQGRLRQAGRQGGGIRDIAGGLNIPTDDELNAEAASISERRERLNDSIERGLLTGGLEANQIAAREGTDLDLRTRLRDISTELDFRAEGRAPRGIGNSGTSGGAAGAGGLLASLGSFTPAILALGSSFLAFQGIGAALDVFNQGVGGFNAYLTGFSDLRADASDIRSDTAGFIANLGRGTAPSVQGLDDITQVIFRNNVPENLQRAFADLADNLADIGSLTEEAYLELLILNFTGELTQDQVLEFAASLGKARDFILPLLEDLPALSMFVDNTRDASLGLGNALEDAGDQITGVATAIGTSEPVVEGFGTVTDTAKTFVEGFTGAFGVAESALAGDTPGILANLGDILGALIAVRNVWQDAGDFLGFDGSVGFQGNNGRGISLTGDSPLAIPPNVETFRSGDGNPRYAGYGSTNRGYTIPPIEVNIGQRSFGDEVRRGINRSVGRYAIE